MPIHEHSRAPGLRRAQRDGGNKPVDIRVGIGLQRRHKKHLPDAALPAQAVGRLGEAAVKRAVKIVEFFRVHSRNFGKGRQRQRGASRRRGPFCPRGQGGGKVPRQQRPADEKRKKDKGQKIARLPPQIGNPRNGKLSRQQRESKRGGGRGGNKNCGKQMGARFGNSEQAGRGRIAFAPEAQGDGEPPQPDEDKSGPGQRFRGVGGGQIGHKRRKIADGRHGQRRIDRLRGGVLVMLRKLRQDHSEGDSRRHRGGQANQGGGSQLAEAHQEKRGGQRGRDKPGENNKVADCGNSQKNCEGNERGGGERAVGLAAAGIQRAQSQPEQPRHGRPSVGAIHGYQQGSKNIHAPPADNQQRRGVRQQNNGGARRRGAKQPMADQNPAARRKDGERQRNEMQNRQQVGAQGEKRPLNQVFGEIISGHAPPPAGQRKILGDEQFLKQGERTNRVAFHNVAQIRAAIGESAEGGQPGENERQRTQGEKRPFARRPCAPSPRLCGGGRI